MRSQGGGKGKRRKTEEKVSRVGICIYPIHQVNQYKAKELREKEQELQKLTADLKVIFHLAMS